MAQTEQRELSAIEQLGSARSVVQKMERLADNSDYKFLYTTMQQNLDNKVASSFSAPSGLDDVVRNIYAQGEAAGFLQAMNFLKAVLEGSKETIAQYEYLDIQTNEDE